MAQRASERTPGLRLRVGQQFGEGGLHVICTEEGKTTSRTKTAKSIGAGGAGSVYPCLYGQHRQRRAVKFLTLNKLDEGRTGRRREDFESTFEVERAVLSQLSHSNISIFHEDGIHQDADGNEWHYLVTDYVGGPMLKSAMQDDNIRGDQIYELIGDLLSAVAYLHQRGVYHCDIKLDNIRMRSVPGAPLDVVLLDWGAAQVFTQKLGSSLQSTLDLNLNPSLNRRFISTNDITHPRHKLLIGRPCSVQELWDMAPAHELHTIGVLLEQVINPDEEWSSTVRQKLERVLGRQTLRVLQDMIDDLKAAPDGDGYRSIDDLLGDYQKLHRNYLAPAGIPELGLATEFHYSVPTATGRSVMTQRLGTLTGHRLVNRLHMVHQLESTYLTFPGASHTRFSHSLATLRNARYYVSHLLNDSRFRRQAEREDLEAALLLALLHDVGHYQLSHMFEDLATDQTSDPTAEQWRRIEFDIPTDDTLFGEVLGAPRPETVLRGNYGQAIHARAADYHSAEMDLVPSRPYASPWQLISEDYGDATAASLMQLHDIIYSNRKPETATPAQRVLAAVLSSDIDADKTAYLVEDALRTGVPYGLGVDLDGILGNLCMPTEDDLRRVAPNPVIGVRRAGLQAAQSVAVNRNQMLSQVYWHYNNRAITAMVKYAIMRLLQENHLAMQEYVTDAMFSPRENSLLLLNSLYGEVRRRDEAQPMAGVIAGGRSIYRRVCEVRAGLVEDAAELNDRLLKRSYPQILALQVSLADELGQSRARRGIQPGELLLDIPSKEREKPSGERGGRVFVYDRTQVGGPGKPLGDESALHPGLKEQHKQVNRVSRVFLAPRWAETIQDDASRTQVAESLVRRLRAELGL